MAHLNVTSVDPFRDGNGRIARIVQSLVLARGGLGTPEFFSIEEYLGEHTSDYYAALREAQGGSYQPERDATDWVAFCLEAHISQARRRVIALEQSLLGGTDRSKYAEEADVSPTTASADLRRLRDAGLVDRRGRGRSSGYVASDGLREGA